MPPFRTLVRVGIKVGTGWKGDLCRYPKLVAPLWDKFFGAGRRCGLIGVPRSQRRTKRRKPALSSFREMQVSAYSLSFLMLRAEGLTEIGYVEFGSGPDPRAARPRGSRFRHQLRTASDPRGGGRTDRNFSVCCKQVTITPATRAILESPDMRLDGFSARTTSRVDGMRRYEFVARHYRRFSNGSGWRCGSLTSAADGQQHSVQSP